MSSSVRFGILSTANIARKVARAIHKSKNATVVAVSSRSLSRAQQFAKEEKIPTAYGSHEELLNDKNVDVVYIPIPTMLRTEWAVKAAQAGKHVLADKPFTSESDLMKILNACKENKVQFMDNTMWVHHKRTHELKNSVFPKLGNIKYVHSVFSFLNTNRNNIRFDKSLEPLGALGDLGIWHPINSHSLGWYNVRLTLWAYDYELPIKVFASGKLDPEKQVITEVNAILTFKEDRTASFNCSFNVINRQWFEIASDKNSLMVKDWVLPYHGDPFVFPQNQYTGKTYYYLSDDDGQEQKFEVGECMHEVELIQTFANIVLEKKIEEKWFKESLHTTKVIDALKKSFELGKEVTL